MSRRTPTDPAELLALAKEHDRVALARLVSLVERGGEPGLEVARLAYRAAVPYTVGLTGAPGAGKSTLTDRLITVARTGWPAPSESSIDQVGVLAIDPTSPFSGGAILGDRVRMGQHTLDASVFIRSMATRGHLGGLALAVPDAVRVLGAAGLPVVFIETVGVGQMEVEIASAADTTVVVVTPGWGDSMQANKAGLLEIADLFVINKADRPGRGRPGGTSSRCSTSRRSATGARPSSTPRPPPEKGSKSCGVRSPGTGTTCARPGSSSSVAPSGWLMSCAGCCWPAAPPGLTSWPRGKSSPVRSRRWRQERSIPTRRPTGSLPNDAGNGSTTVR